MDALAEDVAKLAASVDVPASCPLAHPQRAHSPVRVNPTSYSCNDQLGSLVARSLRADSEACPGSATARGEVVMCLRVRLLAVACSMLDSGSLQTPFAPFQQAPPSTSVTSEKVPSNVSAGAPPSVKPSAATPSTATPSTAASSTATLPGFAVILFCESLPMVEWEPCSGCEHHCGKIIEYRETRAKDDRERVGRGSPDGSRRAISDRGFGTCVHLKFRRNSSIASVGSALRSAFVRRNRTRKCSTKRPR